MCKVLIIEDAPINMLLTNTVVTRYGHATMQAANAVDGVKLAREFHPDIVLMDLSMPQLDGLAATRILKGDPATRDIPIIAVTASGQLTDKEKALGAGCDAYVTKPIVPRVLMSEIESVLRSAGHRSGAIL
jgi:two-component system, cell cycle response regulator DivK